VADLSRSARSPLADSILARLGACQVMGLIARGGMGEVHRAHDTSARTWRSRSCRPSRASRCSAICTGFRCG